MDVENYFKLTDDMIDHLNDVVNDIDDPFIKSRYIGFLSISAVTVYELSIKKIFCAFAQKKHKVFGEFTGNHFNRINGRIKRNDIEKYISFFGNKYLSKYKKKEDMLEKKVLKEKQISIKSSYTNIITWRNQFAHEGTLPHTATYEETIKSYEAGKLIIKCLEESMIR